MKMDNHDTSVLSGEQDRVKIRLRCRTIIHLCCIENKIVSHNSHSFKLQRSKNTKDINNLPPFIRLSLVNFRSKQQKNRFNHFYYMINDHKNCINYPHHYLREVKLACLSFDYDLCNSSKTNRSRCTANMV